MGPEVSITSIHTASNLDFGFMMNNVASKTLIQSKLLFQRDAGSLIAPDTITANKLLDLLAMNLTYLNSMPVNW
jgi:hypothetical protein